MTFAVVVVFAVEFTSQVLLVLVLIENPTQFEDEFCIHVLAINVELLLEYTVPSSWLTRLLANA